MLLEFRLQIVVLKGSSSQSLSNFIREQLLRLRKCVQQIGLSSNFYFTLEEVIT